MSFDRFVYGMETKYDLTINGIALIIAIGCLLGAIVLNGVSFIVCLAYLLFFIGINFHVFLRGEKDD